MGNRKFLVCNTTSTEEQVVEAVGFGIMDGAIVFTKERNTHALPLTACFPLENYKVIELKNPEDET